MAKYKLLAPHFSEEDKLLEAGTEVGDGTEHKWTRPPTVEMEALDEAGRKALERERIRAGERISPVEDLPLTLSGTHEKYDEEVEAAIRDGRPASNYAVERERNTQTGRFQPTTLADRTKR